MRFTNMPLAAILAIAFASCSGGNTSTAGVGPVIPSAPNGARIQEPSLTPSTTTSTIQAAGVITSTQTGMFTIRQVPSSCGGGYFDVHTNSATQYSGSKVAPGWETVVDGSGSCSTSITATSVVTSTAPPITLTGPVESLITGGFTIDSSQCGNEHVYRTPSTSGATPAVGQTASVSGNGACSTYVTASSVTGSTSVAVADR